MRNAEGFKFTKKKKRAKGQSWQQQQEPSRGYEGDHYEDEASPPKSKFYRPKEAPSLPAVTVPEE